MVEQFQQRLPAAPVTKEGIYLLEEFRKEDRSQMSNFDRFMEAIIPEIDIR